MSIRLKSIEKAVAVAFVTRVPFISFLTADSYPPIQAFRKLNEPKDRDWRVTSCNFRLLVNFNACVVVFFLSNAC